MRLEEHIIITLRTGERFDHVPNYLDYLLGAGRRSSQLDGGRLDRLLNHYGEAFRATNAYHARASLGRVGHHHRHYDDIEEHLGFTRTYRIEISDKTRVRHLVDKLRELPLIEHVYQPSLSVVPMSESGAHPASRNVIREAYEPHERIRATEALAYEPGDERVTVSVVDTGVNLGHPELQRKLLAGYNTVDLGMGQINPNLRLIGDSRGPDFTPLDHVGHGSHCAGEIWAQGYHIPRGTGGAALILPIRALAAAVQPNGKRVGVGSLCDINIAIKTACDLGADVINMSLGTPESAFEKGAPLPHADMVKYADHHGCVLVAAAGNSGKEERFYPAALPEVIAVGSVASDGRRSHFSTYGSHLTLCAPGENIISIGLSGYRKSNGTSHAAPLVSGIAALLLSYARRKNRNLKGSEVAQILTQSARPLSGGGFHKETGYGQLDGLAALQLLAKRLEGSDPIGSERRR